MNEIATTETEPTEHMCVTSIKVRNAKGCEMVELDMNGHPLTIIGGGNASGKSSFIDAFCWALGGIALIPPEPVKRGEQRTEIEVRLDGATNMLPWPCVVRRMITRRRDGTLKHELEIVPEDGYKAASPQTLINDLLGKYRFGFDALKFSKEKPAVQAQMLSKVLGLDFTQHNMDRQAIYDRRKLVKRAVQDIVGELSRTPVHDDAPEERISVAELVAELTAINKGNSEIDLEERDRKSQVDVVRRHENIVKEFTRRADERNEKARRELQKAQNEVALAVKVGDDEVARATADQVQMQRQLDEMPTWLPTRQDAGPIQSQLMNVEALNQKFDDMQKRRDIVKQKETQELLAERLTDDIKDLDDEKERQTQEVEWPIEGLGFGNLGLVYKGTLLEELASSEQERVGVAIALRINPKFPFVIIRDGSLLEHARVATVARLVHELGGQCLMERVSLGDECHVILKEGRAATREEIAELRERAAANPIEEPTDEQ